MQLIGREAQTSQDLNDLGSDLGREAGKSCLWGGFVLDPVFDEIEVGEGRLFRRGSGGKGLLGRGDRLVSVGQSLFGGQLGSSSGTVFGHSLVEALAIRPLGIQSCLVVGQGLLKVRPMWSRFVVGVGQVAFEPRNLGAELCSGKVAKASRWVCSLVPRRSSGRSIYRRRARRSRYSYRASRCWHRRVARVPFREGRALIFVEIENLLWHP